MSTGHGRPGWVESPLLLAPVMLLLSIIGLLPPPACMALDLSPDLSCGLTVGSLTPFEEDYDERFSTSGATWGGLIDLRSGDRLGFALFLESFARSRSSGSWSGEVEAILIGAVPRFRQTLPLGTEVFAGVGAVYISGEYSGPDQFGRLIEADGSSVGGAEMAVYGPLSVRAGYRRVFADLKTDEVLVDGTRTPVYPAAATDLDYGEVSVSLIVSIYGGDRSLAGR